MLVRLPKKNGARSPQLKKIVRREISESDLADSCDFASCWHAHRLRRERMVGSGLELPVQIRERYDQSEGISGAQCLASFLAFAGHPLRPYSAEGSVNA
jgi:hypothetical protein